MGFRRRHLAPLALAVAVALAGAVTWSHFARMRSQKCGSLAGMSPCPATLSALLDLCAEELGRMEIARMNLLCAQGLSGTEDLDIDTSLAMLDSMAMRVKAETERHQYRFQQNPARFEDSEGFFRMIMLAVVLAEDFSVRYAPEKIGTAADARIGDGFFKDAHDVFLHGLAGQRRQVHAVHCLSCRLPWGGGWGIRSSW